jgi:hypothetical protein
MVNIPLSGPRTPVASQVQPERRKPAIVGLSRTEGLGAGPPLYTLQAPLLMQGASLCQEPSTALGWGVPERRSARKVGWAALAGIAGASALLAGIVGLSRNWSRVGRMRAQERHG